MDDLDFARAFRAVWTVSLVCTCGGLWTVARVETHITVQVVMNIQHC